MTREEVIKLVQDSDLGDSAKITWIARITEEGLNQEVLDALKDAFQEEIDKGFETLGIDITNTPEYKEKETEAVAEATKIKEQFDQNMAAHSKRIANFQTNAGKVIDMIKTEEVKANME